MSMEDNLNYDLGKFLGGGTFGATFEAWVTDKTTGQRKRVAIKFNYPLPEYQENSIQEVNNFLKITNVATSVANDVISNFASGNNNGITSITCQLNLLCFHTAGRILPGSASYSLIFDKLNEASKKTNMNYQLNPSIPIVYIVTDYLDGEDLSKLIKAGIVPSVAEIRNFLRDMLNALLYLHGKGIAHRDVKPENIIRTRDGRYVLIDFGVACTDLLCQPSGTIKYLSNELHMLFDTDQIVKPLGGNGVMIPLSVCIAGDYYALALTFYELVTVSRLNILGVMPVTDNEKLLLVTGSNSANNIYKSLLHNYNFLSYTPSEVEGLLSLLR